MQLKLNIYNENGEVKKTYTRESYSIRMRQLKNIIETLELDKVGELLTAKTKEENAELVQVAGDFVLNGWETVKELMKDIFPGLTDEEYDDVYLEEVAGVVVALGKFTINAISMAGRGSKN